MYFSNDVDMSETNKYEKVKLRSFGYETSGKAGGDPAVFLAELNSIYQGKIIDDSIAEILTEEERKKLRSEVSDLKNEIEGHRGQIQQAQERIEKKTSDKEKIQQEINDIRLGKDVNNKPQESFSWMKLLVNLFFLIPLSIYLFLFYVATIYKVFYFDAIQIAESSNGTISALPAPGELSDALSFNYLLLFAPFLFFAFGFALHVLLELRSKLKYLYVALVLAVTFCLDFLMAYKIHKNTSDAQQLISDVEPIPLSQDSNFYIILFMGFVVYLIWSILLNASINEWKKRDIIGRRVDLMSQIDDEIDSERSKIDDLKNEIKLKEGKIKIKQEQIDGLVLPIDKLKFCLSEFNAGWLSFLTGLPEFSERLKTCESVYDKFLADNSLTV